MPAVKCIENDETLNVENETSKMFPISIFTITNIYHQVKYLKINVIV